MAEWLLYEHDDGRHAVAPSAEAATFAEGDPAWHRVGPVEVSSETRNDDLWDAAQRKLQAGETLTKHEANAYFAAGLFNPINQVYFRAGLIACREAMARFVEAQSPEIAASIRANWWPKLGPDFGPPRQMHWNELALSRAINRVDGGEDGPPIKTRDDISPTLEALPIALHFLQTPEPAPVACTRGVIASDEALLRQAFDALDGVSNDKGFIAVYRAANAIRARLDGVSRPDHQSPAPTHADGESK